MPADRNVFFRGSAEAEMLSQMRTPGMQQALTQAMFETMPLDEKVSYLQGRHHIQLLQSRYKVRAEVDKYRAKNPDTTLADFVVLVINKRDPFWPQNLRDRKDVPNTIVWVVTRENAVIANRRQDPESGERPHQQIAQMLEDGPPPEGHFYLVSYIMGTASLLTAEIRADMRGTNIGGGMVGAAPVGAERANIESVAAEPSPPPAGDGSASAP
jgi:hypothetical protein